MMKMSPVTILSPCWKRSKLLLMLWALLKAFFMTHPMKMVGMLADKPKMMGMIAPVLLDKLKGIIIPK